MLGKLKDRVPKIFMKAHFSEGTTISFICLAWGFF